MEVKTPANMEDMAATAAKSATPAKQDKQFTVLDYLNSKSMQEHFKTALPKFFDTYRFVRSAMNEFRLNRALQECSAPSVLGYFMQAAALGLEPASTFGQCYPVPFFNSKTRGKECQFILGYRGMTAIARRSGDIISIDAQVVRENDEFEIAYGLEPKLSHKPNLTGDPGNMIGAYAVVRFRDGSFQYKFMPKHEIDAHRNRSKASSSGPWVSDYDEMAKKTVFRSLFKWLPIVVEDLAATQADGTISRLDAKSGEVEVEQIFAEFTVAEPEPEEQAKTEA